MQVAPLTQVVGPVHPSPPHCAYLTAATAPETALAVAEQADLLTVLMTVAIVFGGAEEEDGLIVETGASGVDDEAALEETAGAP